MKDFLTRILRSQAGVSLVQTILAGSIMAGLGLVVAKLGKDATTNKLNADSSYGILDLTGRIQTLVSNNISCTQSFNTLSLAPNSSASINTLKTTGNTDIFAVNSYYAENKIQITGMNFRRTPDASILTVSIKKNPEGKANATSVVINKEFFINAEWTGNNLTSCSSDITNFMDTVASQALSEACESGSLGLVKDGETCRVLAQLGPADFACPSGQSVTALNFDPATRIYTPVCKHLLGDVPNCPSDRLLRRDATGIFTCVSISCPPNSIAQGLDAAGNMRCTTCPSGTYMVSTPSGWQCKPAACNNTKTVSQQYFVGFNGNGDPVCNQIIDSATSCPQGGTLKADASGRISLDCCSPNCATSGNFCEGTAFGATNGCGSCLGTRAPDCSNQNQFCAGTTNVSANGCGVCPGTINPDCSNNGAYCSGRSYSSPNGCGVCTGSKPTDCSDSALHCVGTSYASTDSCGSCTGTKPVKAADWSAWSPSWETRAKAGATCSASCGNGTIQAQRKYVRTCTDNEECGGATCSGPTEEWRDEGTQSCNLGACCTPITVWSHYTCAKTIPGKQWINNCFYKTVCNENRSTILSGPTWNGVGGPTSASGGDTGTQSNCHEKRRKCSGEP